MLPKCYLLTLLFGLILCLQGIHSTVIQENVPHQVCTGQENCTGYACDEDKVCVCTEKLVLECLKKATNVGEVCEYDLQCSSNLGNHSLCYNKTECICDPTKAFDNYNSTKCLPFADGVGSDCEENQQCQISTPGPFSFCASNNNTCQCSEKAVSSGDKNTCLETKDKLDEVCVETIQCLVGNSSCQGLPAHGRCICNPGVFVASIKNPLEKCLKISSNLEEPCEEEIQCTTGMGENSECFEDTKCACKLNHIFAQGQCYKKAGFDKECSIHEQCIVTNSECSTQTQKCACKSGFRPEAEQDSFKCSGCSFVQISFVLIAIMHGITSFVN